MRTRVTLALLALGFAAACSPRAPALTAGFTAVGATGERVRVLNLYPGVTATMVMPARVDPSKRVDLVFYALPNGNTTAQTIGRSMAAGVDWHFDIQNIGAQTRALRSRGLSQAIVVYLEADTRSWPEWRRTRGYERANARIVGLVDQLRAIVGNPSNVAVTLAGHSGGGSFMWGFIEGQATLPAWLERIAFLDANYSFEPQHGQRIADWLRQDARHTMVVVAYDDREIMLDGKKVVSDSGGTWRATQRMLDYFNPSATLTRDTLGDFIRYRNAQMEFLLHPNPANRILHTEMIGEMNAYMHALLAKRPYYEKSGTVLKAARQYSAFVEGELALPAATPPDIPVRAANAKTGSAFMMSINGLVRDEREAAIRGELLAGNVPPFLRTLRRVEVRASSPDSVSHTIAYEVMPDYLAIGSDDDFVRIPMTPYTAQAFCDAFGFVLPTRKMVNDIWAAATTHLEPRPLTEEREASATFLQHQRIIAQQLAGADRGAFVAGIKKDIVVTNKLAERGDRVAIYGWHYLSGEAIQPLYTGHVDWYVDYSHGVRPVRRSMLVDGVAMTYEKVLADARLFALLSDEGVIMVPRYDKP